jgi:hypothetical protein
MFSGYPRKADSRFRHRSRLLMRSITQAASSSWPTEPHRDITPADDAGTGGRGEAIRKPANAPARRPMGVPTASGARTRRAARWRPIGAWVSGPLA